MLRNYLKFKPGDIVLLELPFTDLIGSKLRPVLVVSSEKINEISKDLIVLKISSKSHFPEFEVELNQEDLEEGILKKKSYIHCYSIFTVEKNLVIKKIARIRDYKLKEVKEKLKIIFEL